MSPPRCGFATTFWVVPLRSSCRYDEPDRAHVHARRAVVPRPREMCRECQATIERREEGVMRSRVRRRTGRRVSERAV